MAWLINVAESLSIFPFLRRMTPPWRWQILKSRTVTKSIFWISPFWKYRKISDFCGEWRSVYYPKISIRLDACRPFFYLKSGARIPRRCWFGWGRDTLKGGQLRSFSTRSLSRNLIGGWRQQETERPYPMCIRSLSRTKKIGCYCYALHIHVPSVTFKPFSTSAGGRSAIAKSRCKTLLTRWSSFMTVFRPFFPANRVRAWHMKKNNNLFIID